MQVREAGQLGPEFMNGERHDFKAKSALQNLSCVPDSHSHASKGQWVFKLNS